MYAIIYATIFFSQAGATPLLDNVPQDKYLYELVFFTGSRKNAGTSAKVHMVISGEKGETEPRLIYDDKRAVLKRSGVDVFLMSVPRPLGPLTHLRYINIILDMKL